jgi:hypothetical protein
MSAEELFGDCGKEAGLEIWRIEQLHPAAWPKEEYGKFFSGDSYIVLNTKILKDGRYEWHIHFWLGKDSSQDEKGACALMTIELDDLLGGGPVQHREVQGHESNQFLSLFKNGIQCMDGGVDSAFNHVEPDQYDPRLFHLKGKRNVRVNQVELSYKSMNMGDVFILDAGLTLYQWNGPDANKYEKFKGLEMITSIKDNERGGRPETIFLEGSINDQEEEAKGFWDILGSGDIMSAEEAGDDDEVKGQEAQLFCVSDASGALKVDKIASGVLEKSMLDPNDVFILDSGSELFVWVGKGATKNEKKGSMKYATEYLAKNNRPDWCPITRCVQFGETPVFKSYFKQWDPPRTVDFGMGAKSPKKEAKSDTSALYGGGAAEEKQQMVDDGTGKLTIYRVENLELGSVPEPMYGQFFAGDSYVVLYEYEQGRKEFQLLYFWQGRDSSSDEKAASALLTVQMDDELTAQGKDPTQVRVVMGKEPNHFSSLFKGEFIIHSGGIASAFKNRDDQDAYDNDGVALYHIRGTNEFNTKAIAVEEKAYSLNSGDAFVLVNPDSEFVWYGRGANDEEREAAKKISAKLAGSRNVVEVNEGEEPEEFWSTLGGKTEYPTSKTMEEGGRDPRLFQCSNVTGDFVVEEIFNFNQDDLTNDDVFLLDTYDEVWVWVGTDANKREKTEAFQAALDFVANAPDGRDKDTPILKCNSGAEPIMFTSNFFGWDDTKFSSGEGGDPYLEKLKQLKGEAAVEQITSALDALGYRPFTEKYTYEEIKSKTVKKLDPLAREKYLSDEEFQQVFGMSPDAFEGLAAWKKKQLKKKTGLF